MAFPLSPQQLAVVDTHQNQKTVNISVDAVAGSGKTTLAIELAEASRHKTQCFVAFTNATKNNVIARSNGSLTALTSYQLGLRALRAGFQNVKVDEDKYFKLLVNLMPQYTNQLAALGLLDNEKSVAKEIDRLISQYHLGLNNDFSNLDDMILNADSNFEMDANLFALYKELSTKAIVSGHQMFLNEGLINLTDMIAFPYYFQDSVVFNRYPLVIIDEDQDLSPAQSFVAYNTLQRKGQVLTVGDPAQWIYGFAGALETSHDDLRDKFGAIEMPLSVNYRCGKAIIELAQKFVPHIEAHEGAPEGLVAHLDPEDDFIDAIVGASSEPVMVLNAANAPLIDFACKLFRSQIPFRFNGDKLIQRFKGQVYFYKRSVNFSQLRGVIEDRISSLMDSNPNHASLDVLESLLIILEDSKATSYYGLEKHIEKVLAGSPYAKITLSTIHKSKGDERETVFFTGYGKLLSKRKEFGMAGNNTGHKFLTNLLYVGVTRAKKKLLLVP